MYVFRKQRSGCERLNRICASEYAISSDVNTAIGKGLPLGSSALSFDSTHAYEPYLAASANKYLQMCIAHTNEVHNMRRFSTFFSYLCEPTQRHMIRMTGKKQWAVSIHIQIPA